MSDLDFPTAGMIGLEPDPDTVWYAYIDESSVLNVVEYHDWTIYHKAECHLWTSRLYSAPTKEAAYEEAERQARQESQLDYVSGREKEYTSSRR